MPKELLLAMESGEITKDQVRQMITIEAGQLGLTFDMAVERAHQGTLPKNALGSDVELLVDLLGI